MRCKNCHTCMMDTDTHCPSCHSTAARALAAPPGMSGKSPTDQGMNMAIMLPVFGGAIGGAIYAGIKLAEASERASSATYASSPASQSSPTDSTGAGGPSMLRRGFGMFFILAAILPLGIAILQFTEVSRIAQREATVASAEELRSKEFVNAPPGWIAYTFTDSKQTGEFVTRRRLGNGGEVKAHCILVRVEDKWLVTTVATGFEGNDLVGRLVPGDSPSSQALIERILNRSKDPSAVLPYEFNAVEGCASDQRTRFAAVGILGVVGLGGLALGLWLALGGRREITPEPEPVNKAWAYQPLPKS